MATYSCDQLQRQLKANADNRDLGGFGATVTKALSQKAIHELADQPDFWPIVKQLFSTVDIQNDIAILIALAELGRLGITLKTKAGPVSGIITAMLEKRHPIHFSFGDSDQRYYAAIACRLAEFPLDSMVMARTVVLEDASDKTCRAWLALLLLNSPLSGAIRCITSAMQELRLVHAARQAWKRPHMRLTSAMHELPMLLLSSTTGPFDTAKVRCRRMTLLLKALRTEIDADRVEVDDQVVPALTDLVKVAFSNLPRPERYQDGAKAVDAYVSLVLHTIRMRFRLLTEPAIYETVCTTKRWLPDGGWRRITSTSATVRSLRNTLTEGLVLLLRQGKVSTELVEIHRQISPSMQDAKRDMEAIAHDERGLPPEMRRWLETGESNMHADEDHFSDTDDTAIAIALLIAQDMPDLNSVDLPIEVQSSVLLKAEDVKVLKDIVVHSKDLKNQVLSIARRRNLSVFGDPNVVVDYSPHAHRPIDGKMDASKVRVVKQGVEMSVRRASRVLIRAIVRPST